MNKVLVKLYVPMIEEQYDVMLPINKSINDVITLLLKAVDEFSGGCYKPTKKPILYDKITGEPYNLNSKVKSAGIKNSTEIILI